MIALLQRVSEARVVIGGKTVATIGTGLLVLVGVEAGDSETRADRLAERLLGYRVFADANGRMNLSLRQIDGGLLLVPQFTLVADTTKGTRPGFSRGASPEQGERLFNYICDRAARHHSKVERGQFGANMQIHLINDGPVTFWMQV